MAIYSRAPQGARGLKLYGLLAHTDGFCRAPQGARGLKYLCHLNFSDFCAVAPRKGRVG